MQYIVIQLMLCKFMCQSFLDAVLSLDCLHTSTTPSTVTISVSLSCSQLQKHVANPPRAGEQGLLHMIHMSPDVEGMVRI